jgi:hypothetical protein
MKKLLAVLLCLGLGGCMSLRTVQNLSSGPIGCPPNEITITNAHTMGYYLGGASWDAECKGIKYNCDDFVFVSCAKVK